MLLLRTDTDDVDTHVEHFRNLVQQIVALRRHGLNPVDIQELLPLPCLQRQPFGVIETLELAVILVQTVMAGGETAS